MKRSPGRPPLDEQDATAQISVKLPAKQLSELCAQASRERKTLPQLIRDRLRPVILQNKEI